MDSKSKSSSSLRLLWWFVATFFLHIIVWQPSALSKPPAEVSKQDLYDAINEQRGKVLDHTQAPETYKILDTVFGELSGAQRTIQGKFAEVWNSHVAIIESPSLQAFVATIKTEAGIENHVFVSTALIEKYFKSEPQNSAEAIAKLAGTLAHELAHPLDAADPHGLGKGDFASIASQSQEIRADSEAIEILREAGYPRDGLYSALKDLANSNSTLLEAAASSHPEDTMRLSTQRLVLTLDRYTKGTPNQHSIVTETKLLQQELQKIQDKWIFQEPLSLDDNIKRLYALMEQNPAGMRDVEFNRLLLRLDQGLLKNPSLSSQQTTAITQLFEKISTSPTAPPIFSKELMKQTFRETNRSSEFINLPAHDEFMRHIPFYSSPQYTDSIATAIRAQGFQVKDMRHGFSRATQVMPEKAFFETFQNDFKDQWDTVTKTASESGAEFRIRLTDYYYKKIAPNLTLAKRFSFEKQLDSTFDKSPIGPFLFSSKRHPDKSPLLLNRYKYFNTTTGSELTTMTRETLEHIWADRGFYGLMDIMTPSLNINWAEIWTQLGIPAGQGRSQLLSAVKQFTTTDGYAQILAGHPGDEYFPATLTWVDDSLLPYLRGDKNQAVLASVELRESAQESFAETYLRMNPSSKLESFQLKTDKLISRLANVPEEKINSEFWRLWKESLQPESGISPIDESLHIIATSIDRSSLEKSKKQHLLRSIHLEKTDFKTEMNKASGFGSGQWLHGSKKSVHDIQTVLEKYGVTNSPFATLEGLARLHAPGTIASSDGYAYSVLVGSDRFGAELENEFREGLANCKTGVQKEEWLQRWVNLLDPASGNYVERFRYPDSQGINRLKSTIISLLDQNLDSEKAWELYQRLTVKKSGSKATDEFLEHLLKKVDWEKNPDWQLKVEQALRDGRVSSSELQVDLSKAVTNHQILKAKANGKIEEQFVNQLVENTKTHVPRGGFARDALLENIAWKAGVSGDLLEIIENEKSYNWRKIQPIFANIGSTVSAAIEKMDDKTRQKLLLYIVNPKVNPFPEREMAITLMGNLPQIKTGNIVLDKEAEQLTTKTRKAIDQFKALIVESKPEERIPVIETLVDHMRPQIGTDDQFFLRMMRDIIGYTKGGTEEKLLVPFLKVIPEHERTVTLAYLMSQISREKGSVASLFEVFQTVGIKFGQMSSVWKLFGPEVTKETAKLKDGATPLAKVEVERILKETLTPSEHARIRELKEIIGSASLKTVVHAELDDGSQVAFLIQRPHAPEQVGGNIDLSLRYLDELKNCQMDLPRGMFQSVISGVKDQLADEMRMTKEAQRISEAESHFSKMNQELGSKLHGWHFEVPSVVPGFQVRDNLLVLKKVDGVSWGKSTLAAKEATGPAIVEANLRLLFREGWFNPDGHSGNFLIDEQNKAIYPIDFGQATDFSKTGILKSDDRVVLAKFLAGVNRREAKSIAEAALQMGTHGTTSPSLKTVEESIQKCLNSATGKSTDELMVAIVNAIADTGLELNTKFSFGGIKGLLLLGGEDYVSSEKFAALLKQEILQLSAKKPLFLGQQAYREVKSRISTCLMQVLKSIGSK